MSKVIEYAFVQVHKSPYTVPVSDGYPYGALVAGPMVTLVYENDKWVCNDEDPTKPDSKNEFREIPAPPPEVIAYLESLFYVKATGEEAESIRLPNAV